MIFAHSQEAPRSQLTFTDDILIDIAPLHDCTVLALAAFDLYPETPAEMRFDSARIQAGPIMVSIDIADCAGREETASIQVSVEKLRDSEALHPDAATAILAEILSILIEHTGGTTITWGKDQISIPSERFQASFKPMRMREEDEVPVITPRRVHPLSSGKGPKDIAIPHPKHAQFDNIVSSKLICVQGGKPETLTDIFRKDPTLPKVASTSQTARAATLAATASVAVMSPAIGVPLAAYQALKGGNIRVSTQAFALAAIFSGITPAMASYFPF